MYDLSKDKYLTDPVCRGWQCRVPTARSDLAAGPGVMFAPCLHQLCLSGVASSVLCLHTRPVSPVGASFLELEGITTPAGTKIQNHPAQRDLRMRNTFTLSTEGLNTCLQKTKGSAGVPGQPHQRCLKVPLLPLPQPLHSVHPPCPLHSHRPVQLTRHFTGQQCDAFHSFAALLPKHVS